MLANSRPNHIMQRQTGMLVTLQQVHMIAMDEPGVATGGTHVIILNSEVKVTFLLHAHC